MITCKILADSISPAGHRITTWELTHPRYLHAETLRHRMLAFNAASSRAIPVEKMIDAVRTNMADFEQYNRANKGMAAQEEMTDEEEAEFLEWWSGLGNLVADSVETVKTKAAKQQVNRALEPWSHMTVIVTGTDWHNFYALRAHPAAQPEFQVLAYRMLAQYLIAVPTPLDYGEWHLPLIQPGEMAHFRDRAATLRRVSVARCARVSYTTHDSIKDLVDDEKLHDRLRESGHWSPFEHQATPLQPETSDDLMDTYSGCFKGWLPYRKTFKDENRTTVDLHQILADKPEWVTL